MLPLSLLNAAQNKPMLVELKNGETFNGHLVNCDNFMNITLREVYQTTADGERFWKLKECYIRGSTIKYLRVPDTLLDAVKDEQNRARDAGRGARGAHVGGGARGGRGGPGRGSLRFALQTKRQLISFSRWSRGPWWSGARSQRTWSWGITIGRG
ncbi:hypothetical protein FPV67DRAFT_518195 [Lyophyllum atratum]|nr:hypothetical protein FPV67DRAFT_518195 [Lyophyllum atratum]